MSVLIRNGTLVLVDHIKKEDILIEDGVITQMQSNITAPGAEAVDAEGCYLFPGFIDTHTHFDLDLGITKTADDFITGSKAAVLGGTTTVLDFATQDKGMTMRDAFSLWMKKAADSSCNYGFHMAVSEWNDQREAELDSMIAQGVTSFKMYMVYDNMRVSDGDIYRALKLTASRDCIIGVHCENYDLLKERIRELKCAGMLSPAAHPLSRPNIVEAEAVARLMRISELANAPAWVVHLSTEEGLAEAKRARSRGQEVYLETCPQYLVLTDERYLQSDGEKFIMSPPLRHKKDNEALLWGLREDIDFIGTDHCSFTMEQKALGGGDFSKVPNGGAGVQNRAELIYTYGVLSGKISLPRMAELLSKGPAEVFGMAPQKGMLQPGADGDVVVYDPKGSHVISFSSNAHHCDNSPFEGIKVTGGVRDVFLGGRLVVRNRELICAGQGKYVFRKPSMRPRR